MRDIFEILKKEVPNLRAVYLFGSRATDYIRPDSDMDLAFLNTGEQLSTVKRFFLAQKLADILNIDVDLVDLRQASTIFRFEIVAKGKRIFCFNEAECAYFEMMVYSMYQRFQEERKEIIAEIMRKKTVYG